MDHVVIPTDKTSRLISLTKEDYDGMLNDCIIEPGNFAKVRDAKPTSRQTTFNRNLSNIGNRYRDHYPNISKWIMDGKCSEPTESAAYVLPKDQKEGDLKGRPIFAATDGPGVKLDKRLTYCFSNLLSAVQAHIPDTTYFFD